MRTSILPGISGTVNPDLPGSLTQFYRRDKPLAIVIGFNLVLVIFMLVILPFDSRLVLGSNPWIKPLKFALSFALYAYTIMELLAYLRVSNLGKRIISWTVSICIVT